MVGKSNAEAMKGEEPKLTKLAPHFTLADVARARRRLLAHHRGPAAAREPGHRRRRRQRPPRLHVDQRRGGRPALPRAEEDPEPRRAWPSTTCCDKNFYMHMNIPVAGVRPPGRHLPVRRRPGDLGARRQLQGPRARQPLRRRHQLLPQHRRGEPGAHRDGQRHPRRRAPHRPARSSRPPDRPAPHTTRSTHHELEGKVAIVTGGNSGIGKAIVLALAEQGANIVIDYVANPEATEELEQQIAALGDQAIGVEADVSKVADLQQLVDAAVKAFGRLDIMVNNAGVETRTGVLDTTEAAVRQGAGHQPEERVLRHPDRGQADDRRRAAAAGSSTSPRCTRTGRCRATRRTACRRAACGCSPAPPASSSAPTASSSSASGPGAVDTPINTSTEADPAKMKTLDAAIPHRPHGRARGDRQRRRVPRRRRAPAT